MCLFCQEFAMEMRPGSPPGTHDERLATQPGRPRAALVDVETYFVANVRDKKFQGVWITRL